MKLRWSCFTDCFQQRSFQELDRKIGHKLGRKTCSAMVCTKSNDVVRCLKSSDFRTGHIDEPVVCQDAKEDTYRSEGLHTVWVMLPSGVWTGG